MRLYAVFTDGGGLFNRRKHSACNASAWRTGLWHVYVMRPSSADNDVHVMAKSMEEAFEKKVPELLAAYDPAADGGGRPKVCHPRHMRRT